VCTLLVFVVACVIVFFLDSGDRGEQDSHFWRRGTNDLVRRLTMRPNGELRNHFKFMFVLFASMFVAGIWIFA